QQTRIIRGERTHDRHETALEQVQQHGRIHRVDVAHVAIVDDLITDRDGWAFVGTNQAAIYAAHTHRAECELPADAEHLGVDEAVQYHARHIDRLLIRDAASGDHACFQPQRLLNFGELRAAAVDQYHANTHLVQDGH